MLNILAAVNTVVQNVLFVSRYYAHVLELFVLDAIDEEKSFQINYFQIVELSKFIFHFGN